jgi:antibiotic biosynthesis monooxygenase (ABM) superfamily enzyme
MDSDEILELVKDGVIEPDQVEDFEALDEEVQKLVADGDIDMDDVADL